MAARKHDTETEYVVEICTECAGEPFSANHWRRAVGCATGLSNAEKNVLRHLECYSDWRTGEGVEVSNTRVAVELELDVRAVQRYKARLVAKGWLVASETVGGRGRAARYALGFGEHRAVRWVGSVAVAVTDPHSKGGDHDHPLSPETTVASATLSPESTVTSATLYGERVVISDQKGGRGDPPTPYNPITTLTPLPPNAPNVGADAHGNGDIIDAEVVDGTTLTAQARADASIDTAQALCDRLADNVLANGASRRPVVTRKWLAAMTCLTERPNVTVEQIAYVIDWAAGHNWWASQILTAESLLKHYDKLTIQCQQQIRSRQQRPGWQTASDDQTRRWAEKYGPQAAMEAVQ